MPVAAQVRTPLTHHPSENLAERTVVPCSAHVHQQPGRPAPAEPPACPSPASATCRLGTLPLPPLAPCPGGFPRGAACPPEAGTLLSYIRLFASENSGACRMAFG